MGFDEKEKFSGAVMGGNTGIKTGAIGRLDDTGMVSGMGMGMASDMSMAPGMNMEILDGGRQETTGSSNAVPPRSDQLTRFHYTRKGYDLECSRTSDGHYQVIARGGSEFYRDGSQFRVEYVCKDTALLQDLLSLIHSEKLYLDNGHTVCVGGLPAGLGDTLHIEFADGERIYRSSNQGPMLTAPQAQKIYDAFLRDAGRMGFDFTTAGSNIPLYDDATESYVQGTWTGKDFGREVTVVFTGKHVTITYDGKLTDDTDYVIVDNSIMPNRLKADADRQKELYRYESFHCDVTAMHKKNDFTMSASVYRDKSSSSFDLFNFRK